MVGMLRQGECEFKASPAYKMGPYVEKQTKQESGTVWLNICVGMAKSRRAKALIGNVLYSRIKEKRGRSVKVVREPFPQRVRIQCRAKWTSTQEQE